MTQTPKPQDQDFEDVDLRLAWAFPAQDLDFEEDDALMRF